MATPAEIRSPTNKIVDKLSDLTNEAIASCQGTEHPGTIIFTNGNTAVTGVDTAFVADVAVDEYVSLKPDRYPVPAYGLAAVVINDTSFTLAANYTGPDARGSYVTYTKDQYLQAIEYPSLVDVRVYDSLREHEPNTPFVEWSFHSIEVTDHAENALGVVALSITTHRSNFRLMFQESNEIVFDIQKWLHVHHSDGIDWDYIQFAGFESPISLSDAEQQDERLTIKYFFEVKFLRTAY